MFKHPVYIVLDIPSPMAIEVAKLRTLADAAFPPLPEEITLAGSSGVGPLELDQSPEQVYAVLDCLARETAPFSASFQSIERFPVSPVMFLSVAAPAPFIALHQSIVAASIRFRPSPFPFTPHCTIRSHATGPLDDFDVEIIRALPYPRGIFRLETIPVCELDAGRRECRRLHRAVLSANSPAQQRESRIHE